jgi:hypothetical protein
MYKVSLPSSQFEWEVQLHRITVSKQLSFFEPTCYQGTYGSVLREPFFRAVQLAAQVGWSCF